MAKIGIALGGGGARGLSHIGVLKALQANNIHVNCISGASMGAIVGALYAVEPDAAKVEAKVRSVLDKTISEMNIGALMQNAMSQHSFLVKMRNFIKNGYLHFISETRASFIGIERLRMPIASLLPDIDIRETKIPFVCVAIDLKGCKEKVFSKGSIREAVLGSSSIPGVFPPIEIDGVWYADGGYAGSTPIRPLKRHFSPGVIIGSDVKSLGGYFEKPDKAREIVDRAKYITGIILNKVYLEEADVVISPDVKNLHWTAFDKLDTLVEVGFSAAYAQMGSLKAILAKKSLHGWFRKLWPTKQAKAA